MARKVSDIRELAARIEALEKEVHELRETMSPRERLRRAVERIRQRTKHIQMRALNKAIATAVREVRRERAAR